MLSDARQPGSADVGARRPKGVRAPMNFIHPCPPRGRTVPSGRDGSRAARRGGTVDCDSDPRSSRTSRTGAQRSGDGTRPGPVRWSAFDLRAHDGEGLLVDAGSVPLAEDREVGLALLVTGPGLPALLPQVV